jgi:hypothetical protein
MKNCFGGGHQNTSNRLHITHRLLVWHTCLVNELPWEHEILTYGFILYSPTDTDSIIIYKKKAWFKSETCIITSTITAIILAKQHTYWRVMYCNAMSFRQNWGYLETLGSPWTTRCSNPEDWTLHSHHSENLKFQTVTDFINTDTYKQM